VAVTWRINVTETFLVLKLPETRQRSASSLAPPRENPLVAWGGSGMLVEAATAPPIVTSSKVYFSDRIPLSRSRHAL